MWLLQSSLHRMVSGRILRKILDGSRLDVEFVVSRLIIRDVVLLVKGNEVHDPILAAVLYFA